MKLELRWDGKKKGRERGVDSLAIGNKGHCDGVTGQMVLHFLLFRHKGQPTTIRGLETKELSWDLCLDKEYKDHCQA